MMNIIIRLLSSLSPVPARQLNQLMVEEMNRTSSIEEAKSKSKLVGRNSFANSPWPRVRSLFSHRICVNDTY
jgi:hypothetical protein